MNTNRDGRDSILDFPTDDSFSQSLTDNTIMLSMNKKPVLDHIFLLQIEEVTCNMLDLQSNTKSLTFTLLRETFHSGQERKKEKKLELLKYFCFASWVLEHCALPRFE